MKRWLWFLFGLLVVVAAQLLQGKKSNDTLADVTDPNVLLIVVPWAPDCKTAIQLHQAFLDNAACPSKIICAIGVPANDFELKGVHSATLRIIPLRHDGVHFVNRLSLLRHLIKKTRSLCLSGEVTVFLCEYGPSLEIRSRYDDFIFGPCGLSAPNQIWTLNTTDQDGFFSPSGLLSTSSGVPDMTIAPWTRYLIETTKVPSDWLNLGCLVMSSDVWCNVLFKIIDTNRDRSAWILYGDSHWISHCFFQLRYQIYQMYETESKSVVARDLTEMKRTDWAYHPWVTSQLPLITDETRRHLMECSAWLRASFEYYWHVKPFHVLKS